VCCTQLCGLCGVRDSVICACAVGSGVSYVGVETHSIVACVALSGVSCVEFVTQSFVRVLR